MNLLSFDQATIVTGWAWFQDGELQDYGRINLKKIEDVDTRYTEMCNEIFNIISDKKPNCVVIEGVSLQTNVSTLIILARLQGAIIQMCLMNNIQCFVLSPSVWRKQLQFHQGRGVKRPELKKQAKEYILTRYGIKTTEDECEAITIGCAYLSTIK